MNDANKLLPAMNRDACHPEILDVLVNGELPEPERRELLRKLDESPGGWRACAMAFLESQSWKQACGVIAGEQDAAVPPSTAPIADRSASDNTIGRVQPSKFRRLLHGGLQSGLTVAAMAATFLVALSLGLTLRGWRSDGGSVPGGGQSATAQPGIPPQGIPFPADSTREIASRSNPRQWRTVRVSFPGAAGQPDRSVSVPVTESEGADESWFPPGPDAVPPEVQAALERLGYQVRQQRQLLPFRWINGSVTSTVGVIHHIETAPTVPMFSSDFEAMHRRRNNVAVMDEDVSDEALRDLLIVTMGQEAQPSESPGPTELVDRVLRIPRLGAGLG